VQDPPIFFTQIWIFGLKTNHLATLVHGQIRPLSNNAMTEVRVAPVIKLQGLTQKSQNNQNLSLSLFGASLV
jgi:hypothetical protein